MAPWLSTPLLVGGSCIITLYSLYAVCLYRVQLAECIKYSCSLIRSLVLAIYLYYCGSQGADILKTMN